MTETARIVLRARKNAVFLTEGDIIKETGFLAVVVECAPVSESDSVLVRMLFLSGRFVGTFATKIIPMETETGASLINTYEINPEIPVF